MNDIIYQTSFTEHGTPLIGGVWTLKDQEGFPLEMSRIICQQNGWQIDWLEAMADASLSDRLPALMKEIESFFDYDTVVNLKLGFMAAYKKFSSYEEIMKHKRENARKVTEFTYAALVKLGEVTDKLVNELDLQK